MAKTLQTRYFSWHRWWAIVIKEFIQLKRDRLTFAMIVGIPIIQLTLFGYAINSDPKQLPTILVSADNSPFTRSLIWTMKNAGYFHFEEHLPITLKNAHQYLQNGSAQFIVSIPSDFSRKLLRGEHPTVLLEADASDPLAISNATAALQGIVAAALKKDRRGPLKALTSEPPPYSITLHKLYNPENITHDNIVPALMGVVLTMTLVMMTAVAITRERERGTMENLLAMPVKPLEVISGKIIPYVFIGLIQAAIITLAAIYLFTVPFLGSVTLLFTMVILFIIGNLMLGITISSFAKNQLQAIQMAVFTLLPSILLSGFMFPFRGMPGWAQILGSLLPLTYFVRIVRGVMLKGSSWPDLWPQIWPLLIFSSVMMIIGMRCYRKTLD